MGRIKSDAGAPFAVSTDLSSQYQPTSIDVLLLEGAGLFLRPTPTGGWSGNVLFSHGAAPTVSSELEGGTSVFGMETGVFGRVPLRWPVRSRR